MSLHKSLKRSSSMAKVRSVLTRAERIAQLTAEERFDDSKPVTGLPKTKIIRTVIGKKKTKAPKEEAAAGKGGKAAGKAAAKAAAPAAKAASKAAAKK